MSYIKTKKFSESFYGIMNTLRDNQHIDIIYKGEEYQIRSYYYKGLDSRDWTIYRKDRIIDGMNIDKNNMKPTSMMGYTYDMMGQKTTYKFDMREIYSSNPTGAVSYTHLTLPTIE